MINHWHWLDVYRKSALGNEERKAALSEIRKLAVTFNDWKNIYFRAEQESDLEKLSLANMFRLAEAIDIDSADEETASILFGQWLFIYHRYEGLKKIALRKLMKIAGRDKTKEDRARAVRRWERIMDIVPIGSKEEELAAKKVVVELKRLKTEDKKRSLDNSKI